MSKKLFVLFGSICLVLLVAACVPSTRQAPQSPAPAAPAPIAPAAAPIPAAVPAASGKLAWQVEWERVQTEAKKEGKVVVATTAGQFRSDLTEAMSRYGVKLEAIVGSNVQTNAKALAERRAGLYIWDISLGGMTPAYTDLEPAGALARLDSTLILPDVTDPELIKKTWFKGKLWWADPNHFVLSTLMYPYVPLAINTNLVKPGEIKSYNDLLDPRWKGKMNIFDPTIPGSTFGSYILRLWGPDWLRKLTTQEPMVTRDFRLQTEWLAHGKVAIALGLKDTVYVEFKGAGAPIQSVVPMEGTWLSAGSSPILMFDRAPHVNATKVFVNWMLSKEGQTIVSKLSGGQSTREDTPTDFLPPDQLRQRGVEYWEKETKEASLQKAEDMKLFKDIFRDLIK